MGSCIISNTVTAQQQCCCRPALVFLNSSIFNIFKSKFWIFDFAFFPPSSGIRLSSVKQNTYGEVMAGGYNLIFNSSHKASEQRTQYPGLIDPSTIYHGASCLSCTFFDQFNRVFRAWRKLSWTRTCSSTNCVESSTRAIKWNWKFTKAPIPYLCRPNEKHALSFAQPNESCQCDTYYSRTRLGRG